MDDPNKPQGQLNKDLLEKSSHEIILKWTTIHVSEYLEQLDGHLNGRIHKAEHHADKARYIKARNELKQQQQCVQERFISAVDCAFNQYLNKQPTLAANDSSTDPLAKPQLTLVDNNDLEESLAVYSMNSKFTNEFAELLLHLSQRFSALSGGYRVSLERNPVAPGVFAHALRLAVTGLTLDSITRLIAYKLFESQFMRQLEKLYELLSQHLENHGLLPNLEHRRAGQSHSSRQDTPIQPDNSSAARQQQLFDAIKRLLPDNTATEALSDSTSPLVQMMTGMAELQHSATSTPHIQQHSNATEGNAYGQQSNDSPEADAHIVEIVGLLFDYMLSDKQLPDSVKTLLSYLHTPFLKLALLDQNFFSHPQHPARQLLNNLVSAAEHWIGPETKSNNDVYLKIKSIVQRVLDESDNNARLFSELAFEFNHFLRQHTRQARLAEQRALQATKGEHKLKEIRLRVNTFLKKKVGNAYLSPAIRTLLFEPWANYLAFNLLRFGPHSTQWQHAAQAVDDILWVNRAHNKEELKVRHKIITLSRTLQQGFDTVGYDNSQASLLLAALRNNTDAGATGEQARQSDAGGTTAIDKVNIAHHAESTMVDSELLTTLKKLDVGTWFIFNKGSEDAQRAKLAWVDSDSLHFMFVNHMGQRIATKTGAQLGEDIRRNTVEILGNDAKKPFLEKAMERVLEHLKQRETNNDSTFD